jgi:hypothetical protein
MSPTTKTSPQKNDSPQKVPPKTKMLIFGIITFFIGLILLILSALSIYSGFWGEFIKELGFVLTPAGLIVLAFHTFIVQNYTDELTGKLGELVKNIFIYERNMEEMGVLSIHKHRPPHGEINTLIEETPPGSTIKMLGTVMRNIRSSTSQEIMEKKLNDDNCKLQILVPKTNTEFIKIRAKEENKRDLKKLNKILEADNEELAEDEFSALDRKKIEIKLYEAPIAYYMVITDKRMFLGFYLRAMRGEGSPHLELENKEDGIYNNFLVHFDKLWEDSEPCKFWESLKAGKIEKKRKLKK